MGRERGPSGRGARAGRGTEPSERVAKGGQNQVVSRKKKPDDGKGWWSRKGVPKAVKTRLPKKGQQPRKGKG